MNWLECIGPGWHSIVTPVLQEIEKRGLKILQVKEKFGGLRIYYSPIDKEIDKLIMKAEEQCAHVCEECGKPAKLSSKNHWLKTVCEEHDNRT